MLKRIKRSLAAQISIIILAVVMLCAISVGLTSFLLYRNDTIESDANRALAVAESTASMMDGDAFAEIMASGEKNDYWYAAKAALDDIKMRTGVKYLYVLGSEYTDEMVYFAEGYNAATDTEEELDLWYRESVEIDGVPTYADELFETLETGGGTVSQLYESGDFGTMVSGFSAVTNDAGEVVGVVGVDISLEEVMKATRAFGGSLILIIVIFSAAAAVFSVLFVNRRIGRPVNKLAEVAHAISLGDTDVHMDNLERSDEIGKLNRRFEEMVRSTEQQAGVLHQMSEGDLTMQVAARSDKDVMGQAIGKTVDHLNSLLREVNQSSDQVSQVAAQIATGSQALASGSTQQAATLQQFHSAISEMQEKSEANSRAATQTFEDTKKAGELMAESMATIGQLTESMQRINESSERIAGVIKVVDDIAFQTNILALNAAVEAARAGQHGKGFAVVADEVRNLASKSAGAAKETTELIESNIAQVSQGAQIANRTRETLESVNEIAAGNARAMEEINEASGVQSRAIADVSQGIGELSDVVQENSATAEESAASAQEMSSQAQLLRQVVRSFRLRGEERQNRIEAPRM